jgi:hypothetical protein
MHLFSTNPATMTSTIVIIRIIPESLTAWKQLFKIKTCLANDSDLDRNLVTQTAKKMLRKVANSHALESLRHCHSQNST